MIIYIKINSRLKRSKISERFDFFVKIKLTSKLRFLEGRLLIALRLRLIAWLWRMMRLVVRLWMVRLIAWLRRMMRLIAWLRNISLPCLTVDIVLVVTGSDEFIEEGAVSAVKGVLFSVGVTEVINLKYQVEILTIILVCVTV